jgi:aerobic-type carbon monoxide dehydrogenase small subunit (CoxS/CutS family)
MFAVQAAGRQIRTMESLGGDHPLQRALTAHHALQCGFCTAGFLMLAAGVLEQEYGDLAPRNRCICTKPMPAAVLASAARFIHKIFWSCWQLCADAGR